MADATPIPISNPILEALTAALKSGPAQKREDAFYRKRPQGFWYHDSSTWTEIKPPTSAPAPVSSFTAPLDPGMIRLISWNIDILVPFIDERMAAALQYLEALVAGTDESVPIVVFLQEMGQSDLRQIRDAAWVQKRFFITELDERNWLSPLYGTTTLVDRRLGVESVFRVPWISKFDRDGLFVDLKLSGSNGKALRLCNTHLESLVANPPVRPLQLEAAGKILQEQSAAAALLAGDLNAIQPFDRTLRSDNGLKDTYLELGGKEDSEEGYTWGQQVPQWMREKFGCSRMDKILFNGSVVPKKFERIGIDVKVAEEKRQAVKDAGEQEWVTDHYGVMGDFTLDGYRLDTGRVDKSRVSSKLA